MGRTFKYYPSTAFLPSVALGTLLTKIYLAWERGNSAQLLGSLVRLENLERLGSALLDLAVRRQILGL